MFAFTIKNCKALQVITKTKERNKHMEDKETENQSPVYSSLLSGNEVVWIYGENTALFNVCTHTLYFCMRDKRRES